MRSQPEEALPEKARHGEELPGLTGTGSEPPAVGSAVLGLLRERVSSGSQPGQRTDGYRVALSIEGGGMRGTVSAGMAYALQEMGLLPAFDAVYGTSAGAITAAWLVSSFPEGLRGWARPDYARTLIRWRAVLRRRPVVDVRTLVEVVYQTEFPMDFASVLASAVEWHPLGTDAVTGAATDLRPLVANPAEVRLALRASAGLPFLAGPAVVLRGRRYFDGGLAEPIPFRTPMAQGATHIVVLRSRPFRPLPAAPVAVPRPAREARFLTRTFLRRESLDLRNVYLGRTARTLTDVISVAAMEEAGTALSVFPPVSVPPVSRLTTDGTLLAAAFEVGRQAVLGLPGATVTTTA
ncbi:MAG TPA: patatin-like phospholipase family protein [Trebonia sp.]|nr:patatin-like phospholipase family protein [Trebonia sp.]HUN32563.1 patatin-like phospholipase family protein [Trebonia sp.]